LREQAVTLRRQGKSRRQIKELPGPMSNATLNDALKGEPAPEWTRRPNAKDDLRIKARQLRALGQDYEEIAAALGIAKSTVSLWVRDLPRVAANGTPQENISFRVYIHESADVASAQRFWLEATGGSLAQFRTPTLKRHNPRTVRKNLGEGYHGCLRVDVRRSRVLYHKIEDWAAGVMSGT